MADWTFETWSHWAARLKQDWNEGLTEAWDDAVGATRNWVEGNVDGAHDTARRLWDLLFGVQGAYAAVGEIWSLEKDLPPAVLDVARREVAAEFGLAPRDVAGGAFEAVLQRFTFGMLRDASWPEKRSEQPGLVPLLVGGLVLGIGALCWAKVRLTEAEVENRRIVATRDRLRLARQMLEAKKENPDLDLSDVARVGEPEPRDANESDSDGGGSGFGGFLLLGGLLAAGAAGAAFMWRRA